MNTLGGTVNANSVTACNETTIGRHAVRSGARAGHEPVGNLTLHHDDEPVDRRDATENIENSGSPHVVGQVGDKRPGTRSESAAAKIDLGDVFVAKIDLGAGQYVAKQRGQTGVYLVG